MKTLRIAKDLSLPLDAVTHRIAILAVSGAGKTYTMLKLVEQVFHAGLQVVVVDPGGGCWGLRASADGKGPGLPITILGGEHGDVPLEPTAGETLADFVVDERPSVLLDVADWTKGEQVRFMTAFGERLYLRKLRQRSPMMLAMDEADEFAAQKPQKGEERLLGAMQRLIRRGRFRGIFPVLVTQRSAVLNKDVLTQCQVLIAMRTTGVQDIIAIDEWIHKQGGTPEQREAFLKESASLPDGTGIFWWPRKKLFQKAKVAERETFDSSKTPEIGERFQEPKVLAEVDLTALNKKIAATIERAKQSDPKLLQAEIVRLRGELARKPQALKPATIQKIETPVVKDAQVLRLERVAVRLEAAAEAITAAFAKASTTVSQASGEVVAEIRQLVTAVRQVKSQANGAAAARVDPRPAMRPAALPRPAPRPAPRETATDGNGGLSKQALEMLQELARRYPSTLTEGQLATLSGYSRKSSQWGPNLRALVNAGHVGEHGVVLEISESGLAIAGVEPEGPPSSADQVVNMWLSKLPVQAAAFLRTIWAAHPHPLTLEELAGEAGYSMASSQFRPNLIMLVRNGLVEIDGSNVRMSDALLGVPT